ncbi:putative zinc-binding metallopeptidase [Ornithobacterium rhinotracheale]|uniref:zinc-binding metallopeptidase n=1 Tax=Ornithobacterium rhinotracheale TaxID=28251 RepID=UPI003872B996
MKLNRIFLMLALSVFFASCGKDEVNTNEDVVVFDKGYKSDFDKYLESIYTEPYNVRFVYKWDDKSVDQSYQLVPVKYENAVKMANLVKYLCLDAYEQVAPKGFLRTYFPKNITLIGSAGYRNNGTMILGLADSGVKITLFDINNLNTKNVEALYARYFRTIFHEFSHIMHQTTDYPKEFRTISEKDYVGDSWNNAWKDEVSSLSRGFVSDYSSKEPNEDFVELLAHYVTFSPDRWEEMLNNAGDEGKAKLEKKMYIVKTYMKNVWKIDLDKLRNEVLSRATNLDNVDLDKIKIK